MSDFNKRFDIPKPSLEEIRAKFLSRVKTLIFNWLDTEAGFKNSDVVEFLSLELGESWDTVFKKGTNGRRQLDLAIISGNDFLKTLRVIEECFKFIQKGKIHSDNQFQWISTNIVHNVNLNSRVEKIIALSEGDLGIFWKDGKFYKAGAEELDEKLIKDSLDWLNRYPIIRNQFHTALEHFKNSSQNLSARKDSITNAYSAIEGLSREILNNTKNFDKNSNAIVIYLSLPVEYKNIVHYYKEIAHEYSSRHAGSEFEHTEAEAFVYMTGLLMRLMLQKEAILIK